MQVDDFIIDIFYHFKRSVKRKATLREYMEFTNTDVKKVIKHVTTRWLSLGKSVDRTLLQWEALRSYFLSEFEEDNSLGANTVTREVRLARKFDDPFSKLYVLFVQSVMPVFDHFNTFLQSEEPLIHLLHESTVKLYRALLSRFIKSEVIANTNDILSINIEESKNQRELNSIHIGFTTKQYAVSQNIIGSSNYNKFLQEVQSFFISSSNYLLKSMPALHDPLLKCFSIFLKPCERTKIEEDHVALLTSRFPAVVPIEHLDKLATELLDYQTTSNDDLPLADTYKRIDQFWLEISKMKDSVTGIQRFPNLSNLARFLLLIPHSNSFCEGVFSTVKKILTDSRYNLGKDVKKGHAHSSVYEDRTGIRNNLVGLLITKINVFKQQNIKCFEWQPSKALMKDAKSVTYKNLSSSKS